MRTDIISFVTTSENRKRVVTTLLEYPKRQWGCSVLEELTKLPHATVYRTIAGLTGFGLLKTIKINKKTIIYELVNDSPLRGELVRVLNIERITSEKIARILVGNINKEIGSAILYGSAVTGNAKPSSDIDILVVLNEFDRVKERSIQDKASELSSRFNKTISVTVISSKEAKKNDNFIKSVKKHMVLLYGKEPF
ncbi:MAG TPA: nucleotidyltransferase domain-containing protein [Candidatus Nanoarchaeia archaeon]|nr:nucleotidyltransferase domain-containing protein [Candidatus Nanoarchaeia archaeon]